MRTIVDIPKEELDKLDKVAAKQKVSRAEVVRRAVGLYLGQEQSLKEGFDAAFGSWEAKEIDSSDYQNNLRKEW